MKLTREKLKQIIKEELEEAQETRGELGRLTRIAGVADVDLPTPDQDPQSYQTSSIETEIDKFINRKNLKEDDPDAKLLRLAVRLVDAKGEDNKKLYRDIIKNLINNPLDKKQNFPPSTNR